MSESTTPPVEQAASGSPLVVVRELHKTFLHMGRELPVLKGIDLDINRGEIVAIVGKSGAGKSTLLQIIGTLDSPTSGIIRLGEKYLVGMSRGALADSRNEMIGFVFQFHHLLPEFNALENVMMPGLIQGRRSRKDIQARAHALLEDVGLAHRETHRPGELSGGEQQRVALARALLLKPSLILADEPTGNLDTATSDAIHKLFFEINKKHDTTIVVVTHNLALAEQMPRIITMLDGKVVDDSSNSVPTYEVDPAMLERSRALSKVRYAGFGRRATARAIDSFLMSLVAVSAGFLALEGSRLAAIPIPLARLGDWRWILLGLVVLGTGQVIYYAIAESMGGATFAKMMLRLRVRDESLKENSFGAALSRNLAMFVDSILFGLVAYIGMSGSLIRQRFGDGLAQTVVVHADSLPSESGGALRGALLGALVYFVFVLAAFVGAWMF